ncbi:MAG: right-handed parallel beta-helix repeat-containing protein, partial [Planctomycetia bacterium]|nr:right-handed parallel beta-helix repeat-containing protein [Planctomycetia bacterium]
MFTHTHTKSFRRGNKRLKGLQSRSLRVESLEERALLSVSPADYSAICEQYAEFGLPQNLKDINLIEITANELSAGSLNEAIVQAAKTTESDLIVLRTTADKNSIVYATAADSVSIDIDAEKFGSVTIVSLGDAPLTLDANRLSGVIYTGDDSIVNLGGLKITGGSADVGGGIFNFGNLTVTDSTISGNSADNAGGGIANAGNLTVTNSTISGNSVCAISGNSTGVGGGIANGGSLTVTNSTISGNSAGSGGGIDNDGGILTVTNSTISGNSADNAGGGIHDYYGNLTVTNSTISRNSAEFAGGGISGSYGEIYVYNTIIAENASLPVGVDFYGQGGVAYGYNTLSSYTGWNGENNYEYDSSKPLFTDAANGDFTLAADSQAIDKGHSPYVSSLTDLAGNVRVQGETVDLGAYEYCSGTGTLETRSTVVTTLEDVVNFYDNKISLREAVLYATDGAKITFASDLSGGTIVLGGAEIKLTRGITIDASAFYDSDSDTPGITIDADDRSRVFCVTGGSKTAPVALIGLAITGGYASYGGGIYNYGHLTVTDCLIFENCASAAGGILTTGVLTVTNSTISGNASGEGGGGIINACNGVGNTVPGYLTVTNSLISNNSTSWGGGGISNFSSYLTVTSSMIVGNEASNGGGIYSSDGYLTVTNSEILNNKASGDGGGILSGDGLLTVTNCLISTNEADDDGGGIYSYGDLTVTNCLISTNEADDDGGG